MGLAFLALAPVPLAGAGLAAVQSAVVPPFPVEAMALDGAWLLGMAALWLFGPLRMPGGLQLAVAGGLIGVFLGLFGIAGSWVAVGEPCQLPAAWLATSWPAGACAQVSASGSWLIGIYLIVVGVVSGASLAVLDQLRGRARTTLR